MEDVTKKNKMTDKANNVENTDNTYKAEKADNTGKTGKLSSKHWAIIGIVAALVVLAGALIFFLGDLSAEKLQKQLDLGQKYLEEMNYEEAVVAFETAIEIDPMSVDAYLGLVEVYIRTGDFDTALEYAKKGYEMTGDERLKEKIDMIESGNITASNGWIMQMSYYDADGALFSYLVHQRGEQGREERVSLYNADGSLINEIDIQYNENGERIVDFGLHLNISAMAENLFKVEYEYDAEGNEKREKWYSPDGTLEQYYEYEYDVEGNEKRKKCYNLDGTLEEYIESKYDAEENLSWCGYYDVDGTLMYYFEFEYDSSGNCIVSREYNADGTLFEYSEVEYDADGNFIMEKYYDGDGNLKSEVCAD